MNFIKDIVRYFLVVTLLALAGCAYFPVTTAPTMPGTVLPGILERQIRTKVEGNSERLIEYRTPGGFFGIALKLSKAVESEMLIKKSWKEGCPLPLSELSYLVLTHWGFDGTPKVGELVVDKKLALPVIKAFAELFAARFPIDKMELIEKYDANDDLSMEANNTSAFNCRNVTGKPGVFSKHSYGDAIDINPVQNPYISPKGDPLKTLGWDGVEDKGEFLRRSGYDVKSPAFTFCTERPGDCLVLPPFSAIYVNRSTNAPGHLLPDSAAVKAFTDRGFDWGGSWQRLLDYQHFEYDNAKLQKK
jgi:hypothetical protein